jgi:NADH:ubiquinone oxidoreductase subunit 3 (subunit A)
VLRQRSLRLFGGAFLFDVRYIFTFVIIIAFRLLCTGESSHSALLFYLFFPTSLFLDVSFFSGSLEKKKKERVKKQKYYCGERVPCNRCDMREERCAIGVYFLIFLLLSA